MSLQRSVEEISTDAEAAAFADELFDKLESSKSEIDGLVRRLFENPAVRIKTVRRVISRLSSSTAFKIRDLSKSSGYLRFVNGIVDKRSHLDHLAINEWSALCSFLCRLHRGLPDSSQRFYFKLSTKVFRCIHVLLKSFEAVDVSILSEILDTIASFRYLGEETSAHPYMLGCVGLIYLFSSHENTSVATYSRELGLSIIEIGPFRSQELKVEAFAFCASLDDPNVPQNIISKLIMNMDSLKIPETDIEFSPSESSWMGTKWFRARSFAPLAPFLAAKSLSHLLSSSFTTPSEKSVLQLIDENFPLNQILLQALCFIDSQLTSNDVLYLLALDLQHLECFWVFMLISAGGLHNLSFTDCSKVGWAASQKLSDPVCSSSAAYCLALCIRKLIVLDPVEINILQLLNVLARQLHSSPLSSGSLFLYRTFKELKIVDEKFQNGLKDLDKWFSTQLCLWLASPNIPSFSLELISAVDQTSQSSLYSGKISEMCRDFESFRKPDSVKPVSYFGEKLHVDSTLVTSVTPSNEKLLMWLALCNSKNLTTAQYEYFSTPRFKNDMENLILYAHSAKSFVHAELIGSMATKWPHEDNFDELVHKSRQRLAQETLSLSNFLYTTSTDDPSATLNFIAKSVFASYEYQRGRKALQWVILTLTTVRDLSFHSKLSAELGAFVQSVVVNQSCLSRLRLPAAALATANPEWVFEILEGSCEDIALQLTKYIVFPQTLSMDNEILIKFLSSALNRSSATIDTIVVACADKGGDLAVIIEFCASNELIGAIKALATHFQQPARALLYFVGTDVFEIWVRNHNNWNFPFDLFNADPSQVFQMVPLPFLPQGVSADYEDAIVRASEMVQSPRTGFSGKHKRDDLDLESWAPLIYLKILPLVRISADDWELFPLPSQDNSKFNKLPVLPPLAPEALEWIIEETLKTVALYATPARVYIAIRRCWLAYSASERCSTVLKSFLRSAVSFQHPLLLPILEHLISLVAGDLDAVLASELACSLSTPLRESLKLKFSAFFQTEARFVFDFLYSPSPSQVLSLLDGDFPSLELEAPMYAALLDQAEHCEVSKIPKVEDTRRSQILSSNLLEWTRALDKNTEGWSAWCANFLVNVTQDFSPLSKDVLPDNPQLATVYVIYSHLQKRGYSVFRWFIPYLRDIPAARQLYPFYRKLLPNGYPKPKFPVASIKNILEHQLASVFDAHSDVPLNVAHYFLPQLAEEIIPFLYQSLIANGSNSTASSLMNCLKEMISAFPKVRKVIVNSYRRAHLEQPIPFEELKSLVLYAHDLNMDIEALLFAELLFDQNKQCDRAILADIFKGIDDPDISHGLQLSTDLDTVAASLNPWRELQLSLSRFEVGMDHSDQSMSGTRSLYHSFCNVGMLRMAETIHKPDLYSYDSAFKHQMWELPAPARANTETGLLFALFKNQELVFEPALVNAFCIAREKQDLKPLLSLKEIIKYNSLAATTEHSRLGREFLLSRIGKCELARELSCSFMTLLKDGDVMRSVAYALKLENLAKSSQDNTLMSDHIQVSSLIASAQISWQLGNQTDSIFMLRKASQSNALVLSDHEPLFDRCEVLCTLAKWASESRSETESTIQEEFLKPAMNSLDGTKPPTQEFVYHTFAKFCDGSYQDPLFIKEIKEAKRVVTNSDAKQKSLKEQLRRAQPAEKSFLEAKYSRGRALLESEYRDYQRLMQKRLRLVTQALKMYLESLSVGSQYNYNDSSRIVALWLANTNTSEINDIIEQGFVTVPTLNWIPWLNQLTSCMGEDPPSFQKVLWKLLRAVTLDHPFHTIWYMQALTQVTQTDARAVARSNAGTKFWQLLSKEEALADLTLSIRSFCTQAIALGAEKVPVEERSSFSFRRLKNKQGRWWRETLPSIGVPIPTRTLAVRADCSYRDVPVFQSLETKITIASGISAPKIVHATDSWGERNTMLFKDSKDDLRQDAIMEQVFGQTNNFFAKDREAQKRQLAVRTYNVVSLSPKSGVIEFVNNTKSLIDILEPLHREHDDKQCTAKRARELMAEAYPEGREKRIATFREICNNIKPVLRIFFFRQFRHAEAWFKARTVYSRSAAASSIVGHILGLGDRHCSNILLDISTGEVVHIDLGIAFDQGKALRIPETVPFRLSREIIDGFGSTGYHGIFSRCAEITMDLLREQQDDIFTVLDVLLYDPLYQWCLSPIRGKAVQDGTFVSKATSIKQPEKPESDEAERALRGVRKKLSGRLSSEATVRQLIQQASSLENLALLYEGWAPYY